MILTASFYIIWTKLYLWLNNKYEWKNLDEYFLYLILALHNLSWWHYRQKQLFSSTSIFLYKD